MHVHSGKHGSPHILLERRIAYAGCVIVYEEPLKPVDILIIQDCLGKLTDTSVDPVHDLSSFEFSLEHVPALPDAPLCVGVEIYLIAIARYLNDFLDR
jgi:hypothetical protein